MAYKDSTVVGRDSRKPIYYLELSAGKMESKMETKWKKIPFFRMHFQKDESKIEKMSKFCPTPEHALGICQGGSGEFIGFCCDSWCRARGRYRPMPAKGPLTNKGWWVGEN